MKPAATTATTRSLVGLVSVLVCLALGCEQAPAAIVKQLDYETGDFSQWSSVQAAPEQVSIVKAPVKQGTYAARFLVRPGDVRLGGERAEVLYQSSEKAGTTSWWKWSTRFPLDFRPIVGAQNVFAQWHHTAPKCPVPVAFRVNAWKEPAKLELKVAGGNYNVVTCKGGTGRIFDLGPLERARWYTFAFRVKWSASASIGFIELWIDGKKVIPYTKLATLYSGYGVNPKQGYYRRGGATWSAAIYHDGMTRYNSAPPSLD
jgi:hypothetical protein